MWWGWISFRKISPGLPNLCNLNGLFSKWRPWITDCSPEAGGPGVVVEGWSEAGPNAKTDGAGHPVW